MMKPPSDGDRRRLSRTEHSHPFGTKRRGSMRRSIRRRLGTGLVAAVIAGGVPVLGGAIDPSRLPLRKVDDRCDPVQPRDFVKVNTIFGVAHAAGLRTAWSDKHPAYQIVEGPGTEKTVDDLFTPEINADV